MLTEEKLKNELPRCLKCRVTPCAKTCPLGVSAQEFIAKALSGDYKEAAICIADKNPLPQVCGLVCPDYFCQKACIRGKIDIPLNIPHLQATIMQRGGLPPLVLPTITNKTAAIIGGGPAGLGATFALLKQGWRVEIYEKSAKLGGAARLIPNYRLPKNVLDEEIARLVENNRVTIRYNSEITDFSKLASEYDGIILALGEQAPRVLGIKGEEYCLPYTEFLQEQKIEEEAAGKKRVAVLGGGEVALDCALSAKKCGCEQVEMFVRRRREDMRIMKRDHEELNSTGIIVRELTSVTKITNEATGYTLSTIQNRLNEQGRAEHLPLTEAEATGYDMIIQALGSYCPAKDLPNELITAGDMTGHCGTVVQALASGIEAARALERSITEK